MNYKTESHLYTGSKVKFDASNAQEYINNIRRLDDAGCVDIHATAKAAGADVCHSGLGSGLSGSMAVIDGRFRIIVNKHERECRQPITVAHEIGHYFFVYVAKIDSGGIASRTSEESLGIEAGADYFAHRLIGVPDCLSQRPLNIHPGQLALLDWEAYAT